MSLPPQLSGLRVIDVLCRSGKGAFKLSDAVGDAGFVLGVDPDKSCIERAIAAASGNHRSGHGWSRYLRFEQAFPENLAQAGVSDASYDAVYVNCGLADVFDLPAALAEFHRCLKPGGFLWVAEGVFRSMSGYEDGVSDEPACDAGCASSHANDRRLRRFMQGRRLRSRRGCGCRPGSIGPACASGMLRAHLARDGRHQGDCLIARTPLHQGRCGAHGFASSPCLWGTCV